MKKIRKQRRRIGSYSAVFLSITALILGSLSTVFLPLFNSSASAYGHVTSRSIEMSSATNGANGVSYHVQFTTADSIQSVAIDFCPDSPLYADTCSALTGFSAASAGFTAGTGTAGWTITAGTAHVDVHGAAATGTISFTLTNITNPNLSGTDTFYARIYAYAANPDGYVSTSNPGTTVTDFGGIALSTATPIGITARVQEEITFCVAGAAISNNCANAGANPPSLTIGHGSPTLILDSTAVDTATAYMQTSTNAQSGVAIRMKNNNACGGLSSDGGATCGIPPAGATAIAFTPGTAEYGMNVGTATGGTGTVTATSPYNSAGQYAMDNTSSPDNVTTTYGSEIASTTGAVTNVNNPLTFAAAASNTTPAGIYTATMNIIATGTY